LTEGNIEHRTVDSSVGTSYGPSEFSHADFMVVLIDSFISESPEFPTMIQQIF